MALGLGGPIPPDQVIFTQQPSINDIRPGGRLATEGRKIAARHKGGVLGNLLLELQGASTHPDTRNNKFNPKPKPKDQLKENVWRMRQIQQESLRRQAEANKPVKALWKSQKYNDVPPRVGDYEKEPPSVPRSESARNYLRAHSRPGTPDPVRPRWASPHPAETDQRKRENGLAPRSNRGNDEPIAAQKPTRQPSLQRCVSVERLALNGPKTTTDDKPQAPFVVCEHPRRSRSSLELHARRPLPTNKENATPQMNGVAVAPVSARERPAVRRDDASDLRRSNSEAKLVPNRRVDFIKLNAMAAFRVPQFQRPLSVTTEEAARRKKAQMQTEFDQFQKGSVPKYLVERRKRWAEEEEKKRAEAPDPTVPAGHKKMPEKERSETLEMLKQTESQLLTELHALPVRSDTLRARQQHVDIERKLVEIEEAIKIFSRSKVFIKIDE